MSENFVHLHVHSAYSLLDGAARIEELVIKAKNQGMKALALTDHGVMYGVIPFYQACRKHGLHPIIGCEMYLVESLDLLGKKQQHYHQLLLAETEQGYRNLMQLVTIAHLRGFHTRPYIDKEILAAHHEGLIATSSCLGGEIPQAILADDLQRAEELVMTYLQIFGRNRFFFELQGHPLEQQQRVNQQLIAWSEQWQISLLATNDVHYVAPEDHHMHDCILCIHTGSKLQDEDRFRFETDQCYLKSPQEMERLFCHVPEALRNTVRIAERCQVKIAFGEPMMPRFPVPSATDAATYLWQLCEQGLVARQLKRSTTVEERLEKEYTLIRNLGYADYFLVVWDLVRFAKQQGIAVGPGRGSVAGSLIAYLLGITDVDPLEHGLLFERFLNLERVTWPDIDLDFNYERRNEVIHYAKDRYGADEVAQIITFGTMAPRAAIRDVGRVMDVAYGLVDQVAKAIPAVPGITLDRAIEQNQQLSDWVTHAEIGPLLQTARQIEGMPRHASTHAAGVVIAPEPLVRHVPLQQGQDDMRVTQYAMESLEAIGLIKIDFLGLRNLTVIERALHLADQPIDLKRLPMDDHETFALLRSGETSGVFQLESTGMRRVLQESQPSSFEDLVAILALYRPGPMEQIPAYIAAKQGHEPIEYPHPDLAPILQNTYGIIVYQEQIMQIAEQMAGFRLGQADLLRRAVSKKKRTVLEEQRAIFVQGCLDKGYDESTGQKVYDLIVRFASYGFNRSHSVAYGILTYQTAYLKTHQPLAYMTALLATVMENQDKLLEYIDEAKRLGIALLPPDLNRSAFDFTIEQGDIRFGLGAIKHLGKQVIQTVIEERKRGEFRDLPDFCQRIDLRKCNRRSIEALILAGTMDQLPDHRAQKVAMLDDLLEPRSSRVAKNQLTLFTGVEDIAESYALITPYQQQELLQLERDWLGFYLTGHPLDEYRSLMKLLSLRSINSLLNTADREQVTLIALIREVKQVTTKKQQLMAFLQLEDQHGQLEVILFPRVYQKMQQLLQTECAAVWYVRGTIQREEDRTRLIGERLTPVEQPSKVYLRISKTIEQQAGKLASLKVFLEQYRGKSPVTLFYERTRRLLHLPVAQYGIALTSACLGEIERILGKDSIRL